MLLSRLDLRGRPGPLETALPRPADPGRDVRDVVAGILHQVREEGDAALRALTRRLDGVDRADLRVPPTAVVAALERVPSALRDALQTAHRRITEYHAYEARLEVPADAAWRSEGVTVRPLMRPVLRAGCYAPGGRARYPSTVLMCAAPARVAGVEEVVLCVPPGPDGQVDDATLAAAAIAGVDEVYALGGAQAVAAMAYGTETLRPVDVVVGPGNRYVAEAMRQVAGRVGVASAFAGPSEVVVVAGPEASPALAAVDLVVQAEHGPDGLAWLVTWDEALAEEISAEVDRLVAAAPRRAELEATLAANGYACLVDGPDQAIEVCNVVAPEHLELMTREAERLLPAVRSAGAVFVGQWSPASLGDYLAGPNHVLPTNRTARFASALRVDDFRRHLHVVSATAEGLRRLAPPLAVLATTEGLAAHAESVQRRAELLDDAANRMDQADRARADQATLSAPEAG